MTVLSAQSIAHRTINHFSLEPWARMEIIPFALDKGLFNGMSFGLTSAGYDIRIGSIDRTDVIRSMREGRMNYEKQPLVESYTLKPGEFLLCASLERFKIPHDIQAIVHDKSSLARRGIALQNTVLEPGWEGHITLELSNHGHEKVRIEVGMPIAQVIFHQLDQPTNKPYKGKYQNQGAEPVHAIDEASDA
jgi:dCTP deaminase